MSTHRRGLDAEYEPFPNEEGRNARQQNLEVPALVRALAIPESARILEVGCGRGVALPELDRLCRPRQLIGLDMEGKGDIRALVYAYTIEAHQKASKEKEAEKTED